MDLSDITKAATRKRVKAEAENLREKVSQEAAKIIKLRVGQDASYWELTEKLGDVEREHARLQQNMVDMQMQHETLSSQYQDELRLRPETLNKLGSTRKICDVLEEYMGCVRGTLQRCVADKNALGEAYARASTVVSSVRTDLEKRVAVAAKEHRVECDQLRQNVELVDRAAANAEAARRRTEAEASEARALLAVVGGDVKCLRDQLDQLNGQLAQRNHLLQQKEETIDELQNKLTQITIESTVMSDKMQNVLLDLERKSSTVDELRRDLEAEKKRAEALEVDVKQLRDSLAEAKSRADAALNESLQLRSELEAAVARGDAAANDAAQLREALVAATTSHNNTTEKLETIIQQLQEQMSLSAALQKELDRLTVENNSITQEVHDKTQSIESLEKQVKALESESASRAEDTVRVCGELRAAAEARDAALRDVCSRTAERDEARTQLDELRAESARAAAAAEGERAERADTIARLMRDVTQEADARARADAALAAARSDLAAAHDDTRRLSHQLREKENDIANHLKIILEMRAEKERLQEKISAMQGTIDNIQKELIREPPKTTARRDPPEHDDNAVPAPPKILQQVNAKVNDNFLAPEPRNLDSMIFNFLSDNSMECDTHEAAKARRFDKLSGGPVRTSSSKRTIERLQDEENTPQYEDSVSSRKRTFFKNRRPDARFKRQK